jgi:hypothetical protein
MFKITSLLFSLHSPWFLRSLQNDNSNQLRSVQVPLPSSSRLARPFSLAMQIFTLPAKVLFIVLSRVIPCRFPSIHLRPAFSLLSPRRPFKNRIPITVFGLLSSYSRSPSHPSSLALVEAFFYLSPAAVCAAAPIF